MKKTKLKLHRMTIAHLSGPAMRAVMGAVNTGEPTSGAGVQSDRVDTVVDPCHLGDTANTPNGSIIGATRDITHLSR